MNWNWIAYVDAWYCLPFVFVLFAPSGPEEALVSNCLSQPVDINNFRQGPEAEICESAWLRGRCLAFPG